MPTVLMLDVDGVLVTGRPQDGRFWASDLFKDLHIDPDLLQSVFFRPHWRDVVLGRRDLRAALLACWPQMQCAASVDTFLSYWFSHDARLETAVLEDVRALRAAGMPVFLATNQEHLRAAYLKDTLGLGTLVDGIVYSAQIGAAKPDPAFYAACEAAAGAEPAHVILVDDTPANVAAAQARGWAGHHWRAGDRLRDVLAERHLP